MENNVTWLHYATNISSINQLSGLLIKRPEEQEVAQDDTAPVLHMFL